MSEDCNFVGSCVFFLFLVFRVWRYEFETQTIQNIPVEALPFAISQATIPVYIKKTHTHKKKRTEPTFRGFAACPLILRVLKITLNGLNISKNASNPHIANHDFSQAQTTFAHKSGFEFAERSNFFWGVSSLKLT